MQVRGYTHSQNLNIRTCPAMLEKLYKGYVKEHHLTGVTWNFKGGEAKVCLSEGFR